MSEFIRNFVGGRPTQVHSLLGNKEGEKWTIYNKEEERTFILGLGKG